MKECTVKIGTIRSINNLTEDNRRPVTFVGERLASRTCYTGDDDTRGVNETLFKTEDGRHVVHVENWSRWQGEPNYYSLHEVAAEDLSVNGQFEHLGREAGMGRPLTLDEALEPSRADDS